MKIEISLMRKLDVSAAMTSVTTSALDHVPPLVAELSLADSPLLTKVSITAYEAGHPVQSETFTMPRRGFGLRPVTVMAAPDRVMYTALIESLSASLPPASRGPGKWITFENFGMPDSDETDEYVVNFDIAACYEYIDHGLLRAELVLHSMEVPTVDALIGLLSELYPRGLGLPQMMDASDRLGDTYLSAIERALVRRGYRLRRFADDFKILAHSWAEANSIIEDAADVARAFGLVLSSEKTRIRKAETLKQSRDEVETFQQEYFQAAADSMAGFDWIIGDYGEIDEIEVKPEDADAQYAAFKRVLEEWVAIPKDDITIHSKLIGRAIREMQAAPERLADKLIREIAYKEPIRLEMLCKYLLARTEMRSNWRTLKALASMERQPPWSKLWLLHTADQLKSNGGGESERAVRKWGFAQMRDRHEVVRAAAYWYLSSHSSLSEQDASALYLQASAITRPAIAAALSRQAVEVPRAFTAALASDSPLVARGFDWGKSKR